ncbi:DegT/DnrJ/EryC1/StrS family aminotransferase [Calderihabitans maritimus]|uniref:Pleiotropic regulatory protein n=1 Tax=Calderihabitans maritimus TaxID=1246530 RepID=A0A1Z5HXF1_9FIRM|nr:DegT/DnrJ/EryC1/StrS family aminotransferase [Calderihabitans maritimus]GAW94011.1 Pleiotropic regulatory protein [Calderihabitans maritimus]
MGIPLLDLKAQYESIKEEIDAAVVQVLESGRYILGPNVAELEKEIARLTGTRYAVGVASGTDALLLSLVALGVGEGDEVITSPYTFFATAEVISQVGAVPVFVDIDPETYNLDVSQVEEKITKRTRAIIPVHIFGQPADMDPLLDLAQKYDLFIIEDACQAIGAEYKGRPAGSMGNTGCFSFFPTKNLGGYGDGGMVVTNDSEVAEKIRILRVHGSNPKYYHSLLGYNSRLDELQAAILRVKLKYLEEWNEARRRKAALYDELLAGTPVVTPVVREWAKSVYHLYVVRVPDRDGLMQYLKEHGIFTGVYYPLPLHLQKVYADLGYKPGSLPEAEKAARETLALPLYPEITEDQVRKVVKRVKEYHSR